MADEQLIIRFPALDVSEANRCAQDLASAMTQMGTLMAERHRDNTEAQDFGATLVLVLGTASVTAIAKGLGAWLKRTGTKVEIKKPDGTSVIISDTDSGEIAKITKALSI